MYSLEVLQTLVHALTKSEKRYFRMQADLQQGEKAYLHLFDFLERNSALDADAMVALSRHLGASLEPARKHLYRVLMKSLRQFEADKHLETRLMNLLHESRILYDKGMIEQSLDQLDKIKRLARQGEKRMYYAMAARQELQYLKRVNFGSLNEYQLLEKQKAIRDILEQETKEAQYASLYEILLLRYWRHGAVRSEQEVTQLNDLLLEEYQLLQARGEKTFSWQQLHLHFQSTYFQMSGNPEGSLGVFYELNRLFEQHQALWHDAPLSYFYLLDGILTDLRWMERYADMDFFMGQLKNISAVAPNLETLIAARVIEHNLNRFVDQQLSGEAVALLKNALGTLRRDTLPVLARAELAFAMLRAWAQAGDYAPALKLIRTDIDPHISALSETLQLRFLWMHLLMHAAERNFEYLPYALRSAERKLKNQGRLYATERWLLSLLRNFCNRKPTAQAGPALATLRANPFERQLIKELCLEEWLTKLHVTSTKTRGNTAVSITKRRSSS